MAGFGPIVGVDGFPLAGVDGVPKSIVGVDGFPLNINGQAPVHVLSLDGLSAPALASLRAAWWTRRLLTSYGGTLYDATHLYDQSGNARTITSAVSISTAAEGMDTALVFDPAVPNTFTRGDALGVAVDPALTIAWKMRCTADLAGFPTLLSLGTAGNSEIEMYLENSAGPTLVVSNFAADIAVGWSLADTNYHNYVLTKPLNSGYADTWRLYVDSVPLGAPDNILVPGALSLGGTSLIVGDYDGGGFPFGGHLSGMLVFESELTESDLTLVQAL